MSECVFSDIVAYLFLLAGMNTVQTSNSKVTYKKAAAECNASNTSLTAIVNNHVFDYVSGTSTFKEEFWIGSVNESGVIEGTNQIILKR